MKRKEKILYAYNNKPWEHLIKLTVADLKKPNDQHLVFDVHRATAQDPEKQRLASPPGSGSPRCPWQALSSVGERGTWQWQKKTQQSSWPWVEGCQRQFPKTSSKASHGKRFILGPKTDSEVKYQGHGRQNPWRLKQKHLPNSYLRWCFPGSSKEIQAKEHEKTTMSL